MFECVRRCCFGSSVERPIYLAGISGTRTVRSIVDVRSISAAPRNGSGPIRTSARAIYSRSEGIYQPSRIVTRRNTSKKTQCPELSILLFVVQTVTAMDFGITYSNRVEPLQGHPKEVRLFRETGIPSHRILQESALYQIDGKLLRRITYRDDESISYDVVYAYDESGSLKLVRTLDGSGALVEMIKIERQGGAERSVYSDKAGIETHYTTTSFDQATNVYTAESINSAGKLLMKLSVYYDKNRRPLRARVNMPDLPSELDLTFDDNGGPSAGPDLLSNFRDTLGEFSPLSMDREEHIELTDEKGNWIRKVVQAHKGPQSPDITETLVRTISYF